MLKIFAPETALKRFIAAEEQRAETAHTYLYRIMRRLKTVCLAAAAPDREWADRMRRQHAISADYGQTAFVNALAVHPERVLEHPSALYILDVTATEAERIQKSFGVVCMSADSPGAALLIDTNDEHTTGDREPLSGGWGTVLRSLRGVPSNALLLTDRYLFSAVAPRAGNGIDNVRSILDALLPQRFLGEYQVTVVFDDDSRHPSYTFADIAKRLADLRADLRRDYPIVVEALGITPDSAVYNKLHNRRIVSNYFVVKAEHKLAAFNGDRGTSLQTITPQVLFTADSLTGRSTPPLKSIDHAIAALREFAQSLPRLCDHGVYRYALNGQCMSRCPGIRNRLLD